MVPIAPGNLMVPIFRKVQTRPKFLVNCYPLSLKAVLGNLLVPKMPGKLLVPMGKSCKLFSDSRYGLSYSDHLPRLHISPGLIFEIDLRRQAIPQFRRTITGWATCLFERWNLLG